MNDGRVRVAAVNDYDLIVEGVASMLEKFPDRLVVADRLIIGEAPPATVDVALYDTYGRPDVPTALRELTAMPGVRRVAIFSAHFEQAAYDAAIAAGAHGFISTQLDGDAIADALVAIGRGERVVARPAWVAVDAAELAWPGQDRGLTRRESEVLTLCAEGLSNAQIGAVLFISVETVKSHLRGVYRKLDVGNRVQATRHVRGAPSFRRSSTA